MEQNLLSREEANQLDALAKVVFRATVAHNPREIRLGIVR
jgi:hypothetical protein